MKIKEGNLFLQIIKDWWPDFKIARPGFATAFYDRIIEKVINCGDPSFGYVKYMCLHCGQSEKLIGFSCKTRFCLRCSRIVAADFVSEVQSKLHSGVVYRHLILTIPEELRGFFYDHRLDPELFNLFFKCGWNCVQEVVDKGSKKLLKAGCLMVLHTVGRKGDYKPHLHILVMDGGIDEVNGQWVNLGYFPYEILHKKWQYYLLTMIKEFDPSPPVKGLVDTLWKRFPKGFVGQILKGQVPKNMKNLTKYLSKYLFRPSISLRRIKYYDPKKGIVAYEYASHKTKKTEMEITDVMTFIERMVQQILPTGFQRVRYFGLQATRSFEKSKSEIQAAMELQINSVDLGAQPEVVYLDKEVRPSFSDKIKDLNGTDPLKCPQCGHRMELVEIWTKAKGITYDLLEYLKSKARVPLPVLTKLTKEEIKLMEPSFFQVEMPGFA